MSETKLTDSQGKTFCVKALQNGVQIIGMTRGQDTKLLHTELLDKNEVMVAQFTANVSAVKIRGRALVLTDLGAVWAGVDENPD